jgi:osmotically-inducible protein OsmY
MVRRMTDLAADIREALSGAGIEAMSVEVVDGCVYVHGVAPSYRAKRLAGELAAAAARGACVVNELRIGRNDFSEDAAVQRYLEAAFGKHVEGRVGAEVRSGIARLYGATDDERQRRKAEELAWDAPGVQHVQNGIIVTGRQRDDESVAAALNDYVRRALHPRAPQIEVGYRDGVASLSGAVESVSHGQAIEDLVRWHDGVRDVVNNLRVSTGADVARIMRN